MRVCITGSKGMLGYDLARRLKSGYEIIGVDIDDFDIVNKDVIDFLLAQKPDFLFHFAAYTNVDKAEREKEKAYEVNVSGTKNIVTACKILDIPLVFISTDYVFDGRKKTPYREDDNPEPINFYGETKRDGEKVIIAILKRYFIVRTSWLFGKNGKNFVKSIFSLAQEKENIEVVDDQQGSPTYTSDLAVSLEMFIHSVQYGIYHITNSGLCTWFDFAEKIISLSGGKSVVSPIKSENLKRFAKRPQNSVLDNTLFETKFCYKMPSWEDALGRYLIENRDSKE